MYPNPPFQGFTWPLFQHIGPLRNPNTLFQTLLAAAMFRDSREPDVDITQYLVANRILTPNIRTDSGQANAWRDYQQILSELGLIYSTLIERKITPTPLGLAFLDGALSFPEVMTLQALRYQYPNGHKLTIDESLRGMLTGTPFSSATKLAELHQMAGVEIRPAVLIWRVLRRLAEEGEAAQITVEDIQTYLMRCSTHADLEPCVSAIKAARAGRAQLAPMPRGRRNAQDWLKLLLLTPLFAGRGGRAATIGISSYGHDHANEIDNICSTLEDSTSFWKPNSLDQADRKSWYDQFGSVNLDIALIPETVATGVPTAQQEEEEEKEIGGSVVRQITLRDFDDAALGANRPEGAGAGRTITSTYDAGLANNKHRLHDVMVIYIARTCQNNGARVYDDPNTVDLLVDFKNHEYVIEVKSVTPRNFVGRLRYALGQVTEYDYLRSLQSQTARRKVIAVAAQIATDSWSIPYMNDFLDMDLLSLQGQALRVDTRSPLSRELFAISASAPTLEI